MQYIIDIPQASVESAILLFLQNQGVTFTKIENFIRTSIQNEKENSLQRNKQPTKLSNKYRGIISEKEGTELNNHITQMRNEWKSI